jgi:hypothetical protein
MSLGISDMGIDEVGICDVYFPKKFLALKMFILKSKEVLFMGFTFWNNRTTFTIGTSSSLRSLKIR